MKTNIPQEWIETTYRDIGNFLGGGTPSTKKPDFWNGNIDWTTSRRINDYLYISKGEKKITESGLKHSSTNLVPKGNLLIATRVGVGKVAINTVDMAISQDLTGLIVNKEKFLPEFIAYQTRSWRIQEAFRRQKRGATIKGISREDLKDFILYIPSIDEQEKIAAVLLKIQQAIEVQDSIIEAAQELKKSTMEHVFTHGLRGEKTKETKIGRIPESWETEHLGQKALITAGGTPSRNISAYWKNATIPWVKTSEINYKLITSTEEHITEEGLNNSVAQILPVGTILMAMYGQGVTRGKVALLGIEATTNQACAAIQPYKDINSDFIYYYLTKSYEKLRSLGHGAQQPNLNKQIIQSFTIALPKKDEQKEIADILQAVDKKNKLHTSKTIMLQDLFKTMLNKLMTGQIRVKDLDIDTSCVLEMKNKR